MKNKTGLIGRTLRNGALGLCIAAGTVSLAQTQTNAPSNTATQDSSTASSGGWQRVGEHSQVNDPQQSPDPNADPADRADPNGPPPPQNAPMQNGRRAYPDIGNRQQQAPPQNDPPPPPVPAQLTMQTGTYITVRVNQMLSSDKNQPGDPFTASLMQPVVVNGVVVAEPGQTLGGRVVTAEKHHFDKPARLGIALTDMTLVDGQHVPVQTQFLGRLGGTTSGGQQAGTVATTTGVGAAIGAIAGWGTGAAIGAGAGAAASLIGVLVTRNHASVIYPEQILTFKLGAPVTISTANSAQAFRYVQPNEYDRPTYTNSNGNDMYQSAAPPAPVVNNNYPYPYYGWDYPYYWGPSFAFYGGYWGGGWYPRYYGRGWYGGGGRGWYGGGRGWYGGGRGYAGGRGYSGGFHGGGHR